MKGFKSTGNGPRYVQNFAVGGLATNKPLEGPGWSDFKKGGKAKKGKKVDAEAARLKALSDAGKLLRKARGGKVSCDIEGCSDPMSPTEAMSHKRGGFIRKPKIGK